MSNQLIPTHSDYSLTNKASSLYLGSRQTKGISTFLKAGFANINLQSEMSSAAISAGTQLLSKKVNDLKSSLSPASLALVPNDKGVAERLFDATATAKILTSQVAMYFDKNWRNKLFRQIDSIHDLDEWDEDDKPVKKSSFATFLKAILQIRPQRHPGLGLTYEGYLVAAWTIGQDRLTTEFLPKDRVRWTITRNIDGETEGAAGETSVSRLYECLIPYQPAHWFLHEEN
ncbi:MAG: hypothetical protein ACOY9D_05395 [Pseudomonadota bacterium]